MSYQSSLGTSSAPLTLSVSTQQAGSSLAVRLLHRNPSSYHDLALASLSLVLLLRGLHLTQPIWNAVFALPPPQLVGAH